MKTNKNIIVALIFGASSVFASEAKIAAKTENLIDQSVKKIKSQSNRRIK